MRILFILWISFWCSRSGYSQFYEIYGPIEVYWCEYDSFGLETSEQLLQTTWTVIPPSSAQILTSGLYSAEIQFFNPGVYYLIAQSTSVNGTQLSDTLRVRVNGGGALDPEIYGCYVADSLSGCYRVCAHSHTLLQYSNDTPDWEVTGAENYVQIDPFSIDITWGAGGTGEVKIYPNGHQECPVVLLCFEILPQPTVDFETLPAAPADTLTLCKNQEAYFENLSQNGIYYTWDFGDGTISHQYDEVHAFGEEGFYTVTLIAENICDCSAEKQIVVEVLPEPAPTLDCVNSVCPETRQRYTATSAGCTQYNWSVSSNGTIVNGGEIADDFIEVIWHEGPDGYIELSVSGCATSFCTSVNTFRVPIITPNGPISGDASVCGGEVSTYTAPYFPGTQYQWQVGPEGMILGEYNKNAITVLWSDVNVFTSSFVEVMYDNCFLECGGSDVFPVNITPDIFLTGDEVVCQNSTAFVEALAGFAIPMPASVTWQIENEAGEVIAMSPGMVSNWSFDFSIPPGLYYWVALNNDPSYCTESIRLPIEVVAEPEIPLGILGEREICPGQPYGFTIESAGNYATEWTITDGSATFHYSGQTCQHTFGINAPYVVSAVHTDIQYMACTSDPISITLTTAANLVIVGPDAVCLNAIDSFTTELISGTDYTWEIIPDDHGEIRRSDLNNVLVFWTQPGPVTLRLTACGNTIDHAVLVQSLPSFNLAGPMAACANETVVLSTDQPSMSHTWTNDAGHIIGSLNSVSLFPGSYAVELTDINGCTTARPFEITSYPAPIVHLTSPYDRYHCNMVPGGVFITANTDGAGYQYEWFINDVSQGLDGPTYMVSDFNAYHVEVTNSFGCTTVSEKIGYIDCCPPSNCGLSGGGFPIGCLFIHEDFEVVKTEPSCNHHILTPTLALIDPGQTEWVIKSISKGVIDYIHADVLDYTYNLPGYYQLEVYSLLTGFPYGGGQCGHVELIVDTIRAVAEFKREGICAGSPVLFEDLTTFLPGESIQSWAWDFGDPASGVDNMSNLQHPSHIYSSAGFYDVTLTVTLASGCSTSNTLEIEVSDGPLLMPLYELEYCENEAMAFQLPGQVFDIAWDFGDPASAPENTAVTDSVMHTYALPGSYMVTVSASDIYQCRSTAMFSVDIVQNTLSGLIDVDPVTPLCIGDTAILTAPAGGQTWSWSNGETTAQIDVTESNQYNVLIRDQYHCPYSPPPVFVEVFPKPEVIIKARRIEGPDEYGPWVSTLNICFGTEFELQAFSTGQVSYQWSDFSTNQILQFTYEGGNLPQPGILELFVTTYDLVSGCVSDTSFIEIEIYALPDVPVISLVSGSACSFNDNVLQVNSPQPGITYIWSDGQTGPSITVTESGNYFVEAFNEYGCNTMSNTLVIQPSALVDQIPGGCFIACDPLSVCLPTLFNVASFTIFQNGTPYLSGTSWPQDFEINTDGTYTIEVTSFNGCTAESDPLDVMLYTGVGSITVQTYQDIDGDGTISVGDILISGIPVQIVSNNGLYEGMTETNISGHFVFEDYPSTGYTALFDQQLLSSQWMILIDSVATQITTCGDSVVVSLLLTQNCTVSGPDQLYELCPGEILMVGDSTWSDTGAYMMHMSSVSGCDSVFQVVIQLPDSIEINGLVWVDVDHNGMISPADTLISGIPVILTESATGFSEMLSTDGAGSVQWNSLVQDYQMQIDTASLSGEFDPLIFEEIISDTLCGSVTIQFLIESACPPVFVILNEELCPGDSFFVEGQWISDPGLYSFIHTDTVTLCETMIDVYVTVTEEIMLNASMDWNCDSLGSILLNVLATPPYSIEWSQGITGDTVLTGLQLGNYSVMVTDSNGCVEWNTFTIEASPVLSFDVPSMFEVNAGDSVLISISGDIQVPGISFEWLPGGIIGCPSCSSTWVYPTHDTTVVIQITDEDSCEYQLITEIVVTIDSNTIDQIYVPNVFTPNGDGINDRWTIFSKLDNTYVHTLVLYDRWGELVISKEEFLLNTFEGWDGMFNGKTLQPGVFAYTAVLTLGDGRRQVVKGDVTLVR